MKTNKENNKNLVVAREICTPLFKSIRVQSASLNAIATLFADSAMQASAGKVRALLPQCTDAKALREELKREAYEDGKLHGHLNKAGELVPSVYLTEDAVAALENAGHKCERLQGDEKVRTRKVKATREVVAKVQNAENGKYKAPKTFTEVYEKEVTETLAPYRKTRYTLADMERAFLRLTANACTQILRDAILAREQSEIARETAGNSKH